VQPYPGVLDQLAAWRAAGRPLALVTNKPRLFAERILDHVGLAPLLDACVFGDTLPQRKPDPAPLREALRLLGFAADRPPPAAGTMVGDGVQDLRAGKAAGLRTAAVLFGFHPEERLRAEGADEYWRAFGVPTT
jgi:phosphoglycolate phosphatase